MSEIMQCGDTRIVEIKGAINSVSAALKKLQYQIVPPKRGDTTVQLKRERSRQVLQYTNDRAALNRVQPGDLVVLTTDELKIVSKENKMQALSCEVADNTIVLNTLAPLVEDGKREFRSGFEAGNRRHLPLAAKLVRAANRTKRRHSQIMRQLDTTEAPDLCALYAGSLWYDFTGDVGFMSVNAWEVVHWAQETDKSGRARGRRLFDAAGALNGSTLAKDGWHFESAAYQDFLSRYVDALEKDHYPKLATMHYSSTTHRDSIGGPPEGNWGTENSFDFNSHVTFITPNQILKIEGFAGKTVQQALASIYPTLDWNSPILEDVKISFPDQPRLAPQPLASAQNVTINTDFNIHDTLLDETFGNRDENTDPKPKIQRRSLRLALSERDKVNPKFPRLVAVSGVEMTEAQRKYALEDPKLDVVAGPPPAFTFAPFENLNDHLVAVDPQMDLNSPEAYKTRQTYALLYGVDPAKLRPNRDVIGLLGAANNISETYQNLREELVKNHRVLPIRTSSTRADFEKSLIARVLNKPPSQELLEALRAKTPSFFDLKLAAIAKANPGSYFAEQIKANPTQPLTFEIGGEVFIKKNFWNKLSTDMSTFIELNNL